MVEQRTFNPQVQSSSLWIPTKYNWCVAQLVEHPTFNRIVESSNLSALTILVQIVFGSVSQLVEQQTFNLKVVSSSLTIPTKYGI
jgi:hypothetical protein